MKIFLGVAEGSTVLCRNMRRCGAGILGKVKKSKKKTSCEIKNR
jgi:hypothetical protein